MFSTHMRPLLALLAATIPLLVTALPSHRLVSLQDDITPAIPLPIAQIPPPVNFEQVNKQDDGNDTVATLFACEDVFWSGTCALQYYKLGSGDCNQLDGKTSAVGPDKGYSCTFYRNAVCRDVTNDGSDSLTLVWPGESNLLQTSKGNFNDGLLGYQCFKI